LKSINKIKSLRTMQSTKNTTTLPKIANIGNGSPPGGSDYPLNSHRSITEMGSGLAKRGSLPVGLKRNSIAA
jgi:hypothetical protein